MLKWGNPIEPNSYPDQNSFVFEVNVGDGDLVGERHVRGNYCVQCL